MMTTAVIAEHELFDSCRVLFGAEITITRNFLEYLQRAGIKSAYRKKALETHPDMLASQGDTAKVQGADLFRIVQQSYENLNTYLDARDNGFRFPPPPRPASPRPAAAPKPAPKPAAPRAEQRWSTADFTSRRASAAGAGAGASRQAAAGTTSARPSAKAWPTASIPGRKLLFGHYLYYAGVTNWQTIIKALVWQRMGRPRLGEIGRRFGWLTDQDILTVLKRRQLSASFGAAAVALGLLTERQLRLMLFHQNRLQKRFGDYFVQHKLLTPLQVDELARHFSRHNTTCERHGFACQPGGYRA